MKLPRDVSSQDLIKLLVQYGYIVTRQKGSHIRLTRESVSGPHHITIPDHDPLKVGTLAAIVSEVARHLGISRNKLFK